MANHRTKEQEQALRDELLRVSIRTFLRDGYEQTTMKQLAEAAKCTTGASTRTFPVSRSCCS